MFDPSVRSATSLLGFLYIYLFLPEHMCPYTTLGRILQSAAYLGRFFLSAITLDETAGAGMYLAGLPIFVVRAPALVGVVIYSALVSA